MAGRVRLNHVEIGDCRDVLRTLPDATFQCCVTSPPYWGLRDYGHADQIGLEATPDAYVAEMVAVFREVRRVLRPDGTLWLNLGDSYASGPSGGDGVRSSGLQGSKGNQADFRKATSKKNVPAGLKPKDIVGIPWRVAFALQADGWWLRSDIVWSKSNPMPESVTDRPSKSHEYVFLLAKSEQYHYDHQAIRETEAQTSSARYAYAAADGRINKLGAYREAFDGAGDHGLLDRARTGMPQIPKDGKRNARSVWTIPTQPYSGAHFATMPEQLVERCILAGCPEGSAVLDPFFGSGTVGEVAERLGRQWFGIELNPNYKKLIDERTAQAGLRFVP